MHTTKICRNKCIFCFIAQMPPGMRPSLYVRDDDYLESFTHGNFITLTNISNKELQKIIKFEIRPLNISLHSFNRDVRNRLFGNKRNYSGIKNLIELDGAGITTNIQVVLCPGINDGKDLENTLDNLINRFKNVLSAGIVPVGITKYNRQPQLTAFDRSMSLKLIEHIESYKRTNKNNPNARRIFLSDEFYLLASKEFPDFRAYGKFVQIQNGIGKTVDFIHEFKDYLSGHRQKDYYIPANNILIVTSEYGRVVFSLFMGVFIKFIKSTKKHHCLKIDFLTVKNDFFGGNIKVTGLLTGKDIINALKQKDLKKYDSILIPSNIFNIDGLTLDDHRTGDFKQFSDKISFVEDSGTRLAEKIFIKKRDIRNPGKDGM